MPAHIRESTPVQLTDRDTAGRTTTARAEEVAAEVFLQPIAAPSILGLYGFAGATFMVAANLAGWYGGPTSAHYLFPFAAFFGGLAQFLAGMWAYKARDGLATAMHGMWGSFWMAYGLLNLLFVVGVLAPPSGAFVELGYWFVGLAITTWIGAWIATGSSRVLAVVLVFLAAGSTATAVANLIGSAGSSVVGGYLFIIAAVLAWYTGTALLAESSFGRTVLPVFKPARARHAPAVSVGAGEPGVMHGQ
jgi:succinate-acetate transporter protein